MLHLVDDPFRRVLVQVIGESDLEEFLLVNDFHLHQDYTRGLWCLRRWQGLLNGLLL
jgi:hypothetical protein